MANAKTAANKKKLIQKFTCPQCGGPKRVVKLVTMNAKFYTEALPQKTGFFWQCESTKCKYIERT